MYAYDEDMPKRKDEKLPISPLSRAIGSNLRRVREALDLTQDEMAAKSGRSQSSYSSLERGEAFSQMDRLDREIRRAGGDPMDILRTTPAGLSEEQKELLHLWAVCDDGPFKGGVMYTLREKIAAKTPRSATGLE